MRDTMRVCNRTSLSPGTMKYLFVCFFAVFILLIIQVFINVKDFNDAWILEGLFSYFLLFVLAYSVVVSFSSSLKSITIITSIFLVVVNLIPNFKYVFIYGHYDALAHYGFTQEMINSGHIPETGFYKDQYGSTPGLHIFLSTLSLMAGVNVSTSMKIFMTFFPSILPLAFYLVVKRLDMPNTLSKTTVVSAAIISPLTYNFTGTSSVYFFYVPFLCLYLLFVVQERDLQHAHSFLIINILFAVAILISHDVTSIFLLAYFVLTGAIFMLKKVTGFSATFPYVSLVLTLIVMIFAHFLYESNINFTKLLLLFKESISSLFLGRDPLALSYYKSFYGTTLLGKVAILAVRWVMYAVALLLVVLAPLTMRGKLKDIRLRKFYNALALPLLLPICVFLLSLFVRELNERFIYYFLALSPFLAGATLFYLVYSRHRRFNNAILAITVFSLICVSVLQLYPFQPLIPRISTSYRSYYVVDWRQVNTAYDRSVIRFANRHNAKLPVATDNIMKWLIYGLADPSFQALVTKDDLLSARGVEAPLILVSNDVDSHVIPSGREAMAYEYYVRQAIQKNSVIYTNGKSHVLLNFNSSSFRP